MKKLQGDSGKDYFRRLDKPRVFSLRSPATNKAIEKAFALTIHYEGTNYTGLEGSFDKQGFTYGIFGFCLGQGSLQNLLKALHKKNPALFRECCNTIVNGKPMNLADHLLRVSEMGTREAVAWSLERQSSNHKPLPHWTNVFRALGKEEEFKQIQKDFGMQRMEKALTYCKKYSVETEAGLALMFDTCIQQGSIKLTTQARLTARGIGKQNYIGRMRLIAKAMSDQANPRWANDVYSRRIAIVNGRGEVHGEMVEVQKEYGITHAPITV